MASAPRSVNADTMTTRTRPLDHDPVETVKAIHLRHVHVERDDVGLEGDELVECLDAVSRRGDLEVGFGLEDPAEESARQCGVVHDKEADHDDKADPSAAAK